jgi:hypothetical protein
MKYSNVRKVADADFPTRWGHFRILGFEGVTAPRTADGKPSPTLKRIDSNSTSSAINLSLESLCCTLLDT